MSDEAAVGRPLPPPIEAEPPRQQRAEVRIPAARAASRRLNVGDRRVGRRGQRHRRIPSGLDDRFPATVQPEPLTTSDDDDAMVAFPRDPYIAVLDEEHHAPRATDRQRLPGRERESVEQHVLVASVAPELSVHALVLVTSRTRGRGARALRARPPRRRDRSRARRTPRWCRRGRACPCRAGSRRGRPPSSPRSRARESRSRLPCRPPCSCSVAKTAETTRLRYQEFFASGTVCFAGVIARPSPPHGGAGL